MKMLPLLCVLLWVCGCSPQKTLAYRLKGADRVVVTNTIEHLSISVTGAEVDKIIHAFSVGKKESPLIDAALGLRLQFYKGAEHLEDVATSYTVFWAGNSPYSDTTKVLKSLNERFREESSSRP